MNGAPWSDAAIAALLFAVDPVGTGGILLRSRAGPPRERWLSILRSSLPPDCGLKRAPIHIAEGRLLGGLDLSATLLAGRPVAERGLLAESDGCILMLAMAERLSSSMTAHVTATMDLGEVAVERDGLSLRLPARFGVVALDEGLEDEFAPSALTDRLAFHIDLSRIAAVEADELDVDAEDVTAARQRLPALQLDSRQIDAICTAAAALGIVSLRAPLLAIAVARASAALAGTLVVTQEDIALAARLVLAPRALVVPQSEQPVQPETEKDNEPSSDANQSEAQTPDLDRALDEVILAAAEAAIPPDVLQALRTASLGRSRFRSSGKSGELHKSKLRGRPVGVQRGELKSGAKLNVIETLRAAAPWQPLRRAEFATTAASVNRPRVFLRKSDFRTTRFKQRTETTAIFVVDASGSAALHRLAEAKGAVELLLADCYIRRDQVAMIAFRGNTAEQLLPPTRSLARAKRSLAGLPGGGGTPLAAGLDAAFMLADAIRRKGQTPTIVLLTDGRANIARDGTHGRQRAEEDAMLAGRQLRAARMNSILVDTSPRPGPSGETLSREMGARYLPLPHADAATLSQAILATTNL